ncbi:MAG: hypothetical protein ACTHK0_19030 [Ginsengibacter sp.]
MNKKLIVKILRLYFLFQVFSPAHVSGQVMVSGNVYDSSKLYAIPDVTVFSTSGATTLTDSTGTYHILVKERDSLSFFYNGKSTIKFPVKSISNYTAFDISLRVKVKDKEKYKLLNPVTVFMSSYQQDSLENRQEYAKIFGAEKPGIHSTYDPGGVAGLDLDALVGMFQFRKNKQQSAFRSRLLQEEQENYIDYRFSSKTISRITGFKGDTLEQYKKMYRPSYFFVVNSSLAEFYQYILSTSYAFKKQVGIQ